MMKCYQIVTQETQIMNQMIQTVKVKEVKEKEFK